MKTRLFLSNLVFGDEFHDILNLVKFVAKNQNHSWSLDGRFSGPIITQDTVLSLKSGKSVSQKIVDTTKSFVRFGQSTRYAEKVRTLYVVEINGSEFAVCADNYRKL